MNKRYSLKRLLYHLKEDRKKFFLAQFLALLATLASVPTPLLMPVLVDEVLLHKPGVVTETINNLLGSGSALYYTLIVLGVVIFLRISYVVLNILQNRIFETLSKKITYSMREEVLRHLQRVSMAEYETLGSGNVASRLVTDIETVDKFLSITISRFLISVLSLVGISVVLLMIHWQLALFILFLNPAVIMFATKLSRKVAALKRDENRAIEAFQSALVETLEVFEQIRAANKETDFFKKLLRLAAEVRERSVSFSWKSDAASRLSFLVFVVGFEIFRAAGILAVAYSNLSIGLMLAIFGYLWFMMTPIQEILGIQYAYKNATVAIQRINELFELKTEPEYPHIKNPFAENRAVEIVLENIHFSYGEKEVLKGVDMKFAAGKKSAVVGASGSGKTTLARILVGFYPIQKGDIFYNGVSIKEIGLDVVRENVALVLQSPVLFNDTLEFNLTLGKNHSPEEIRNALKMARLEEVVKELPEGLKSIVGKGGVKLSGGQRQRVAIARMILQNPKVVILDESTSALDMDTERELFDMLEEFLRNRTTIIIAHRVSTIKQADYIYVLDEGRVVEMGDFEKFIH